MNSVILTATSRLLLPVMLLFSIAVLLRGHNEPGGGFVGGLIAAAAVVLHAIAVGPAAARRLIGLDVRTWLGIGLAVATAAALAGPLLGHPVFKGLWTGLHIPLAGELKIGTPLLFDVGVYLVVAASMLTMILTLQEHDTQIGGPGPDQQPHSPASPTPNASHVQGGRP
jgi:multicomponent Na+:H+ antiporter subunit B